MLKIPVPHFVTFYNGKQPLEAESILRLSDMYEKNIDCPELELMVRVININTDNNAEFPIVKDTTPNMMNPRLYTTSYNKP